MQPPPQARFNMFNTPNAPRGRFDWSVLSEGFELLKINPGTFVAFTLVGGLAAYTISQIVNLPQVLLIFAPGGSIGSSMFAVAAIFSVLANLAMIAVLGFVRSGIMIMGQKVMRRQLPDIPEGFQQLKRFFTYAGCNVSGWLLSLPFIIGAATYGTTQITSVLTEREPDFTALIPSLIGTGTAYILGAIVLLFTYPFFALAVPAAFVEGLNFKESIKRSFELGKANYGNLLLFSLVAGIINNAAMSCCCLPFLFVYPWIAISFMLIFRDVANVPLVSEVHSPSQTPYPREYGMTMPTYDATTGEIPRSEESHMEPPQSEPPQPPPTDQTPG